MVAYARMMLAVRRWKAAWLVLWGLLFVVSLPLPAVVREPDYVFRGFQAALAALVLPVVVLQPVGVFLVLVYPLLILTLFLIGLGRPFAVGAAVALVATMLLWGFAVPAEPQSNLFGGSSPGGELGAGYWVWLVSGLCLVAASVGPNPSREHGKFAVAGSVYALVLVAAVLGSGGLEEVKRRARAEQAERVMEEKRKSMGQPPEESEASPEP